MPTGIPAKPVAVATPPESVGVLQAFPFQAKATVPVAPPPTLAVHVEFCVPYVRTLGEQETVTVGVVLLNAVRGTVGDWLTVRLASPP